jgi:hypothetical protein
MQTRRPLNMAEGPASSKDSFQTWHQARCNFTLSRSTMAAARTPAAAAMADTHSELYWFGRMSAAARLMLAYTTIVVRFSADGAASIERLEINESENTAGR